MAARPTRAVDNKSLDASRSSELLIENLRVTQLRAAASTPRWAARKTSMLIRCFTSLLLAAVAVCMPATHLSVGGSTRLNRRDAGAVLRAYFAAWNRNDTATQKSLMAAQYANADWYPEPVESVRLVSTKLLDEKTARLWSTGAAESTRVYQVVFDYHARGPGFSMARGRYTWTYVLTLDAQRRSWLISNYGAG